MLHESSEADAYEHMLRTVQGHIQRRAKDLLAKQVEPCHTQHRLLADLMKYSTEIHEDEYSPSFVMIDGDNAERLAVERVFPGKPIRMCQFHFMQACTSRIRGVFGRSRAANAKTAAVLESLRRLQRCHIITEWDDQYQTFKQDINNIANDGGEALEKLADYFDRVWFSPVWRSYCVDYGMPSECTRDGPWSTNNYAEAAFRVFDRVFLCCRVNKR